jgi:hypothetical protein
MTTLRLSPSGPDVANSGGGEFDPGTGARLRLAEAVSTVGSTTNVITTVDQVIGVQLAAAPVPGDSPMSTNLLLPSPAKNYRATLCCDAMSSLTNANITLTIGIQTSPDGTTWTTKVQNEHWLGFAAGNTGADNARHCRLDLTLRSGAALGVVALDAQLAVRGIIKASAAGATVSHPTGSGTENGVGSAYIVLEELF